MTQSRRPNTTNNRSLLVQRTAMEMAFAGATYSLSNTFLDTLESNKSTVSSTIPQEALACAMCVVMTCAASVYMIRPIFEEPEDIDVDEYLRRKRLQQEQQKKRESVVPHWTQRVRSLSASIQERFVSSSNTTGRGVRRNNTPQYPNRTVALRCKRFRGLFDQQSVPAPMRGEYKNKVLGPRYPDATAQAKWDAFYGDTPKTRRASRVCYWNCNVERSFYVSEDERWEKKAYWNFVLETAEYNREDGIEDREQFGKHLAGCISDEERMEIAKEVEEFLLGEGQVFHDAIEDVFFDCDSFDNKTYIVTYKVVVPLDFKIPRSTLGPLSLVDFEIPSSLPSLLQMVRTSKQLSVRASVPAPTVRVRVYIHIAPGQFFAIAIEIVDSNDQVLQRETTVLRVSVPVSTSTPATTEAATPIMAAPLLLEYFGDSDSKCIDDGRYAIEQFPTLLVAEVDGDEDDEPAPSVYDLFVSLCVEEEPADLVPLFADIEDDVEEQETADLVPLFADIQDDVEEPAPDNLVPLFADIQDDVEESAPANLVPLFADIKEQGPSPPKAKKRRIPCEVPPRRSERIRDRGPLPSYKDSIRATPSTRQNAEKTPSNRQKAPLTPSNRQNATLSPSKITRQNAKLPSTSSRQKVDSPSPNSRQKVDAPSPLRRSKRLRGKPQPSYKE